MKSMLFAALAGAAALLLPLEAAAQRWDDRELRTIRVDASPFDLSTPGGIDALEKRVAKAVNRICGSDRYCREEAWASTDDQVEWAIARDERMRQLAYEREAQLRACEWGGCAPQPVYHAPPPPPVRRGTVTVTVVHDGVPPHVLVYQQP